MSMAVQSSEIQRQRALTKANHTRSVRAQLKLQVRQCSLDAVDLLDMPECASMKIVDLLTCQRGIGEVRARQVLRRAGVSPSRELASLTERERTALFGWPGSRG